MQPSHIHASSRPQAGSALFITVILLLLAGLMTLFALNVGIFEQRSTTNDLRNKMVTEVAEAGLSQGFEVLMRQHRDWMNTTTRWEPCSAADDTFPCGAVPALARGSMYRYRGTAGASADIPDALEKYMLPLPSGSTLTSVGNNFNVAYGVAPVLCFVKKPAPSDPPTTPIRCTTDLSNATNQRIATFVSVAMVPGEAARTTLTQTIGQYSLLGNAVGVPPILASGSVDLTGTLQVVTNANSGGPGVPVSIWTRKNVDKHGTPNTCYADEFFRYGTKGGPGGTPTWEGNTADCPSCMILTCDACSCDSDKSLSYDTSGNLQDEGMDILDIDGNTPSTPVAKQVNYDVVPSEFPCDLFEYVFGVKAWTDTTSPPDYFCETKLLTSYSPSWNQAITRTVGVDEAYLYKNANKIVVNTGDATAVAITAGSGKISANVVAASANGGIVWCQKNCDIGINDVLGSPSKPVVVVLDPDNNGKVSIKGRVFGILVVRSLAGGTTSTPGYAMSTADVAAGGNASLDMSGQAAIYGALVVQGQVNHANGSASVISSPEVLKRIGESDSNFRSATLPGAWTDLKSY